MATFLRTLSYRYQSLYDGISWLAALSVGGEARFRQLALQNLEITIDTKVLDLCCGCGQTTKFLVQKSNLVTGLDISPVSLQRAAKNVPEAKYVEGLAQDMPLASSSIDIVHTSSALHEMTTTELEQIFSEVYRILESGGIFTLIDFHAPTNSLFWFPLAIFMWLFETETAWQLLKTDLIEKLEDSGFQLLNRSFHAGGSLQVIQVIKP
ncbi:putative enzyme [Hyella patelloides LEGE 07179]|uniref:Putative enzyme n=1 Tax=Hyella patelloides LEGE 07179 TaxID=945734 RepID=A0A563VU14_9CYAN|nr:class I SAM-dependent methyltransferase [Hyella patelloides]VEP14761.1 putative enzyme [Hyella patelloides LEGE 07179]